MNTDRAREAGKTSEEEGGGRAEPKGDSEAEGTEKEKEEGGNEIWGRHPMLIGMTVETKGGDTEVLVETTADTEFQEHSESARAQLSYMISR